MDNTNDNEDGFENITNIDRIIVLLEKFTQVLSDETKYLQEMKIDKIKELHDTKIKLMKWLNIFEGYLSKNRSWIDSQKQESVNLLKHTYTDFEAAISENHEAFRKAVMVNEYVMNWVHKEFKQINQNILYNQSAKSYVGTFIANNSNDNLPITIDEEI